MPTKKRQFTVGGVYHIFNRGVDKREIFLNSQDYSRFILGLYYFNDKNPSDIWTDLLSPQKEYQKKRETSSINPFDKEDREPIVELLAFTLMPNHYHLIVKETQEGGVQKFMQKLGAGYSIYFNQQNKRSGSLFESRYKCVPIKTDTQLSNSFVYVHTNPVELKDPQWKQFKVKNYKTAVAWVQDYPWSSYRDYMGETTYPEVTNREFFEEFYMGKEGCAEAVKDWIKFKATNAELDRQIASFRG